MLLRTLILVAILPYGLGFNEECVGLDVCIVTAKLFNSSISDQNAIIRACQNYFNCETDKIDDFTEISMGSSRLKPRSISSKTMLQIIKTKAIRKPKSSYNDPKCFKCERKRSKCTTYYIYTYGICGGAYLFGGSIPSWGCNIITIPRTVDCMLNTFFNCYLKNCGLIGL